VLRVKSDHKEGPTNAIKYCTYFKVSSKMFSFKDRTLCARIHFIGHSVNE